MLAWRFARSEMLGKDVPHWRTLLLVHRSPSGYLVALARFNRPAVIQLQLGNAAASGFARCAGVDKTADTNHVAALLVVGVGIEEIVADVFENVLDLGARHARDVSLR